MLRLNLLSLNSHDVHVIFVFPGKNKSMPRGAHTRGYYQRRTQARRVRLLSERDSLTDQINRALAGDGNSQETEDLLRQLADVLARLRALHGNVRVAARVRTLRSRQRVNTPPPTSSESSSESLGEPPATPSESTSDTEASDDAPSSSESESTVSREVKNSRQSCSQR